MLLPRFEAAPSPALLPPVRLLRRLEDEARSAKSLLSEIAW